MLQVGPDATKEQIQQGIDLDGGVTLDPGKYKIPVSPSSPGLVLKSGVSICGGHEVDIEFVGEGLGIHGFEVEDCSIHGITTSYPELHSDWNMHFDLRGCDTVEITACTMNNGAFGVRAGVGGSDRYGSAARKSQNIYVDGCLINNVSRLGVLTKFGGCDHIRILNNTIKSSDSGIAFQTFPLGDEGAPCFDCVISENSIEAQNNGIVISGNEVWCRDNRIYVGSDYNTVIGVRLTTDPLRLRKQKYRFARVRDNVITLKTQRRAFGVLVERSRSSEFTDIQASGNSVVLHNYSRTDSSESIKESYATMFVESDGENDFLTSMICDHDYVKLTTKEWGKIGREMRR